MGATMSNDSLMRVAWLAFRGMGNSLGCKPRRIPASGPAAICPKSHRVQNLAGSTRRGEVPARPAATLEEDGAAPVGRGIREHVAQRREARNVEPGLDQVARLMNGFRRVDN